MSGATEAAASWDKGRKSVGWASGLKCLVCRRRVFVYFFHKYVSIAYYLADGVYFYCGRVAVSYCCDWLYHNNIDKIRRRIRDPHPKITIILPPPYPEFFRSTGEIFQQRGFLGTTPRSCMLADFSQDPGKILVVSRAPITSIFSNLLILLIEGWEWRAWQTPSSGQTPNCVKLRVLRWQFFYSSEASF